MYNFIKKNLKNYITILFKKKIVILDSLRKTNLKFIKKINIFFHIKCANIFLMLKSQSELLAAKNGLIVQNVYIIFSF